MNEQVAPSSSGVSPEQRWLAVHSIAGFPPPPAYSTGRRVDLEHVSVLVTPMPSLTIVEPDGLTPERAAEAVRSVADVLRAHGRTQAAWNIELDDPLLAAVDALGFTPYSDPPMEPEYAALVMDRPPAKGNPRVDVREVRSVEDAHAVVDVIVAIHDINDDDAAAMHAAAVKRIEHRGDPDTAMIGYIARLDGACVGEANAVRGPRGWYLGGATVVPHARGLGVYQALTRRRWDDAEAAGTPLLTVHAGQMSRPRLEKLGFRRAATVAVRCQRI